MNNATGKNVFWVVRVPGSGQLPKSRLCVKVGRRLISELPTILPERRRRTYGLGVTRPQGLERVGGCQFTEALPQDDCAASR